MPKTVPLTRPTVSLMPAEDGELNAHAAFAMQKVGEAVYGQQGGPEGPSGPSDGDDGGAGEPEEGTVEGEFREV